ncbi:innexin shaking-B-like [Belonocnema kinseyi]|uniref:innexin shaking-B-like n=1 Tax=Belonocnema kinseyi TaxID=2817044 RepID=UPI00143D160D|nr:innexin shaking-B-like [Belonocnema kinseyi]
MKSPGGKTSDRVATPDVRKETGRRGSKSSSSNKKGRRRKLGWIRLARSKRKSHHDVWIMDAVRNLYFLFHVNRVRSDGCVTRLHVLTAILLIVFSVMLSTKQAVGNPIDCIHTRDIPAEAFNAYCWMHSTYFVTGAMMGVSGRDVAFPGVAPSFQYKNYNHRQQQDDRQRGAEGVTKHVKYYQWVPFVLVFQKISNFLRFKKSTTCS